MSGWQSKMRLAGAINEMARARRARAATHAGGVQHPLLTLQQTIGNRRVLALLHLGLDRAARVKATAEDSGNAQKPFAPRAETHSGAQADLAPATPPSYFHEPVLPLGSKTSGRTPDDLAVTRDGHTTFSPKVRTHPRRQTIEAHEAVHRAQFAAFGQQPVASEQRLETEAAQGAAKLLLGHAVRPQLAAAPGQSLSFTETNERRVIVETLLIAQEGLQDSSRPTLRIYGGPEISAPSGTGFSTVAEATHAAARQLSARGASGGVVIEENGRYYAHVIEVDRWHTFDKATVESLAGGLVVEERFVPYIRAFITKDGFSLAPWSSADTSRRTGESDFYLEINADRVIEALEGYTDADDSRAIVELFWRATPGQQRVVLQDLLDRADELHESLSGPLFWLFEDLLDEDRKLLGLLLVANGVLDRGTAAALMAGRTWAARHLPVSTEAGTHAAQFWADLYVEGAGEGGVSGTLQAAGVGFMGSLASLWTPETAASTVVALTLANLGYTFPRAVGIPLGFAGSLQTGLSIGQLLTGHDLEGDPLTHEEVVRHWILAVTGVVMIAGGLYVQYGGKPPNAMTPEEVAAFYRDYDLVTTYTQADGRVVEVWVPRGTSLEGATIPETVPRPLPPPPKPTRMPLPERMLAKPQQGSPRPSSPEQLGLFDWAQSPQAPAGQSTVAPAEVVVHATFKLQGSKLSDVNPTSRDPRVNEPTIPGLRAGNLNMFDAHAEIGAMVQAYRAGLRGGHGVLWVKGRAVCPLCRGDVKTAARALELDSLLVVDEMGTYLFEGEALNAVRDGGATWRQAKQ